MNQLLTYEKMVNKTLDFYKSLGIKNIPEKRIKDAVTSLTMPQYTKEYNDNNKEIIKDHRALATLGDAVCGALLLKEKYNYNVTSEYLTNEKKLLENDNLNNVGRELLNDNLFWRNNDLDDINRKSYATAFEAVIGFISLIDIRKAEKLIKKCIYSESIG